MRAWAVLVALVGCGGAQKRPPPSRPSTTIVTVLHDSDAGLVADRNAVAIEWMTGRCDLFPGKSQLDEMQRLLAVSGYVLVEEPSAETLVLRVTCDVESRDFRATTWVETGRLVDSDGDTIATEHTETAYTDTEYDQTGRIGISRDGAELLATAYMMRWDEWWAEGEVRNSERLSLAVYELLTMLPPSQAKTSAPEVKPYLPTYDVGPLGDATAKALVGSDGASFHFRCPKVSDREIANVQREPPEELYNASMPVCHAAIRARAFTHVIDGPVVTIEMRKGRYRVVAIDGFDVK